MYKKKKRGQSAIEWGILIPFLILIIASVLELSPLMNGIIVIDKATEYAASSAAKKGTSNTQVVFNYASNLQGLLGGKDNSLMAMFSGGTDGNPLVMDTSKIDTTDCKEVNGEEVCRKNGVFTGSQEVIDGIKKVTPSNFKISTSNDDGIIDNTVIIVPGTPGERFSGSWLSVTGKHEYKILTPLLQAVLGGSCDTGGNKGIFINTCNYFPITKTVVYRVE